MEMNKANWSRGRLSDIADIIMGQSPPGEFCNNDRIGIPLLNGPTEFGNYHPIPVQYTIDARKYSQIGDIMFCVRGSTTGRMNYSDQIYAIGRGIAAIRHKAGKSYQPYLKAVLEYNLPILLGSCTGSTFPNVSQELLYNLEITVPPLETQKEIAHIIGTLDDKIELNRRMNKTLEEIAQALYMHWFIDFEFPNLEGKPYKSSGGEMIDSELGLIPQGWRVGKLRDICEKAQYGYTASATDVNTGVKFLRITDINKEPWIEWARVPYCVATPTVLQKYKLKMGDIVIARMADPGQNAYIENDVNAVFASYLIRFKPKMEGYGRYIQYWLRNSDFWDQAIGSSMSTTRVSLNAESLSNFQLVIPEYKASTLFTQIVQDYRRFVDRTNNTNDKLGTMMRSLLYMMLPIRS